MFPLFVLWECPDLCTHAILLSRKLSLSHSFSFSVSKLVSSLPLTPLYPSRIKAHNILSSVIIDFNKIIWDASCCFTYKRLITIRIWRSKSFITLVAEERSSSLIRWPQKSPETSKELRSDFPGFNLRSSLLVRCDLAYPITPMTITLIWDRSF
jgi:hypothetical protein